ncbi:DUF4136 domain-containing protein [Mucilaginibacter pocheonensis]|uniref:DUF4136 domain-containing protein n=1 Tax=Mucilaginibacter pocheonensis TaxID=398050 RepID=A0ABU1TGW8_9SPHI|nr:DUF4136 domain-containing protein [Mucilaginibacter pocheonensis]MDR6944612.1 hypothetical protein [Mucilaginibacter pocheonensis]
MKRAIYTGLAILLVSALSACSSYNYYTAARNKTDLSSYRTFAWLPPQTSHKAGGVVKKEIADEKVKDAAIAALQTKGLKLQENDPDLLVSYSTVTGRGMKTEFYPAYYGGFGWGGWGGWGWGWGWGYRPFYGYYGGWGGWGYPYGGFGGAYARVPYKEGTLIIDLIDRNTRRLVWRGFGVGELHNPKRTLEELPKVVDGVLKQLQLNQINQMQVKKA